MPYCEIQDISAEFKQEELARLTGDSSGTTIDESRITLAIERAEAIVNAYLEKRFSIPLSSEQAPFLKQICVSLAVNSLYEMKYKVTSIPESVMYRRRNAVNFLKLLSSGDISLASTVHGESAPPMLITNKKTDDRLFNKDVLDKFMS